MRPTVLASDTLKDELYLGPGLCPATASPHDRHGKRAAPRSTKPLAAWAAPCPMPACPPTSTIRHQSSTSVAQYGHWYRMPKYIQAGDIFQVVLQPALRSRIRPASDRALSRASSHQPLALHVSLSISAASPWPARALRSWSRCEKARSRSGRSPAPASAAPRRRATRRWRMSC